MSMDLFVINMDVMYTYFTRKHVSRICNAYLMSHMWVPHHCSTHLGDVIRQSSPFNRCLYLMSDFPSNFLLEMKAVWLLQISIWMQWATLLGVTFNVIVHPVYITRLCKMISSLPVTPTLTSRWLSDLSIPYFTLAGTFCEFMLTSEIKFIVVQ